MSREALLLLAAVVLMIGLPAGWISAWWQARARQSLLAELGIARSRYLHLLRTRMVVHSLVTFAAMSAAILLTSEVGFWIKVTGLLFGALVGFNAGELLLRILDRYDAFRGVTSDESRVQTALKEAAH